VTPIARRPAGCRRRLAVLDGRLVAEQAEQERLVIQASVNADGAHEADPTLGKGACLIGEEDLDVTRSSIHTSRLISTRRLASCRLPADSWSTTAGSNCGEIPTAMASENNRASIRGRCKTTLIAKITTVSTAATCISRNEKLRSPA
jgi:hypothetical protein